MTENEIGAIVIEAARVGRAARSVRFQLAMPYQAKRPPAIPSLNRIVPQNRQES